MTSCPEVRCTCTPTSEIMNNCCTVPALMPPVCAGLSSWRTRIPVRICRRNTFTGRTWTAFGTRDWQQGSIWYQTGIPDNWAQALRSGRGGSASRAQSQTDPLRAAWARRESSRCRCAPSHCASSSRSCRRRCLLDMFAVGHGRSVNQDRCGTLRPRELFCVSWVRQHTAWQPLPAWTVALGTSVQIRAVRTNTARAAQGFSNSSTMPCTLPSGSLAVAWQDASRCSSSDMCQDSRCVPPCALICRQGPQCSTQSTLPRCTSCSRRGGSVQS